MNIFRRRRKAKPQATKAEPGAPVIEQLHRTDAMRPATPWTKLLDLPRMLTELVGVFKDPRGKMSSKRFGAGALIAAGIALVTDASSQVPPGSVWPGFGLCALGVVLFALTRWEPGGDQ